LVFAGFYEIRLASGEYEGAVKLIRSGSPSDLTPQDVLTYPIESLPVVRVSGPVEGGAVIRAVPGGGPTLHFMNLAVSLRSLRVEASGENAISISGGSLVLENVHVGCTNASNSGVYCHRSNLYLGGTNSIRGPFADGISLRTYSLARPGTKQLPNGMVLEIDGSTRALFLRDFSTFTSTFNSGVIRIWNADAAVYAILGSNVFLTGGAGEVFLDLQNVKTAFHLTHRSEANVHNMRLNRLAGGGDFFLGRLMSILSIEGGTSPSNLIVTNLDRSSWVQVPAAWNAIVPAR
jgi:hypothetical protein